MLEKGRGIWDACDNVRFLVGKTPSRTDLPKLQRFYRCLMAVFNKTASIDMHGASKNCKDQTSLIFRGKEAFDAIVRVCKEYESGRLCVDAPELTANSKKLPRREKMSMNWWRKQRFVPDSIVIKVCEKLMRGDAFFGKKDKQRQFDTVLQSMVNKEAALSAVRFLLRSDKDLTGEECDIEEAKGEELGKLIDGAWASRWVQLNDRDQTITPAVRAKIPQCLENMYMDIKEKCLNPRHASGEPMDYMFSYDISSEGGKIVNVNGIDIEGFESMEADSWKEGLFLIDQIHDCTVGKVMEVFELISKRLLANEKRSTIVLFINDNQRDSLYAQLTTCYNGIVRKVFHGHLLRHESRTIEGVQMHNMQSFLVVFLERGDASLNFKHAIPKKKLGLFYAEKGKAKYNKHMEHYKEPKHAEMIVDLVDNLLLSSRWKVCLYKMGYAAEALLRKGKSVTIVDTKNHMKVFDVFFSLATTFEKETSNVEIEYVEEEVTDSDASTSEEDESEEDASEEDASEEEDRSVEEENMVQRKGKRKVGERDSPLTIERRGGKKQKGSTSRHVSIRATTGTSSVHVVPEMSTGEESTPLQVVDTNEPLNERQEVQEMQDEAIAIDVERSSASIVEKDAPTSATVSEQEYMVTEDSNAGASVGMHGGEALASTGPTSAIIAEKECMVVEESNPGASVSMHGEEAVVAANAPTSVVVTVTQESMILEDSNPASVSET